MTLKKGLRGRAKVKDFRQGAQSRLRRFRQGSALAVALTALILMIWVTDQQTLGQEEAEASTESAEKTDLLPNDPAASLEQATSTVRDLVMGFYAMWPRVIIAAVLILLAVMLGRGVRALLQRSLGKWERTTALSALIQIGIVLTATAAALSVLAGDARALFGSIGLVGLALSWALQTPIESFTGWLMNSFRGYYRVGDRIEVGEVFGDVYKIDVLTTTVWEAGGPGKPVAGAQATGAMITFPNWEVLRSNIINYSRDFPYVWDEVTVNVANESDLRYTAEVFEKVARRVFGEQMAEPAREYHELLARARLAFDVEDEPKAFISLADAWTDCTVRYLVPARSRRRWASELSIALTAESEKPEHKGKIIGGYPRQEYRPIRDWHDEMKQEPK
jgi:small conductance mechanosensitive channel